MLINVLLAKLELIYCWLSSSVMLIHVHWDILFIINNVENAMLYCIVKLVQIKQCVIVV
jgi:hypothetical protein